MLSLVDHSTKISHVKKKKKKVTHLYKIFKVSQEKKNILSVVGVHDNSVWLVFE